MREGETDRQTDGQRDRETERQTDKTDGSEKTQSIMQHNTYSSTHRGSLAAPPLPRAGAVCDNCTQTDRDRGEHSVTYD